MVLQYYGPKKLRSTVERLFARISTHLNREDPLLVVTGPAKIKVDHKVTINKRFADRIDGLLKPLEILSYGPEFSRRPPPLELCLDAGRQMETLWQDYSFKEPPDAMYHPAFDVVVVSLEKVYKSFFATAFSDTETQQDSEQTDFFRDDNLLVEACVLWELRKPQYDAMRKAWKAYKPIIETRELYENRTSIEWAMRETKRILPQPDDFPQNKVANAYNKWAEFSTAIQIRNHINSVIKRKAVEEAVAYAVVCTLAQMEIDIAEYAKDEEVVASAYKWAMSTIPKIGIKATLAKTLNACEKAYERKQPVLELLTK